MFDQFKKKCRILYHNIRHGCEFAVVAENTMQRVLIQVATPHYSDENDIPEPRKKTCMSREKELEEMLDGLNVKFLSLPLNDPLRINSYNSS